MKTKIKVMTTKQYLGDGVHVEIENGMFKLTTDDGRRITNTIYMDSDVLKALLEYIKDAPRLMRNTGMV